LEALRIKLLSGRYGVARLSGGSLIPDWIKGEFISVTLTTDELSVTCLEDCIPDGITCEKGWRVLKILGPLDFALVGILSRISGILAEKQISIFAISTFDTDYILVKNDKTPNAVAALKEEGFVVTGI